MKRFITVWLIFVFGIAMLVGCVRGILPGNEEPGSDPEVSGGYYMEPEYC